MERNILAPLLAGVLLGAVLPALIVHGVPAMAGGVADDLLPASHDASPEGDATASSEAQEGHAHGDDHAHPTGDRNVTHPVTPGSDAHPHSHAAYRHAWPPAEGEVPTRERAESTFDKVHDLVIRDDTEFTPSNFVRSGSGTADDPYVIEHVYVRDDLYVADTSKYLVIRETYVGGQLTLNWVGDKVHVHHNHIRDLRVNENVPRDGRDTMGLIEENEIGFVGQIRHYDGVFRENTVGPHPGGWMGETSDGLVEFPWQSEKVAQLDGMHGGDFHDNTFHGWVEVKLHGHHHASCYACVAHDHANESAAQRWDHTARWNLMSFHDNTIHVDESPVALRYTDENHAGDDKQAASEDVEALNRPHTHHTEVHLRDNVLDGGGLRVDIFNAPDEDHEAVEGWLYIEGNDITLREPDDREQVETLWRHGYLDGVHVRDVQEARDLVVRDNTITFEGEYTAPDDRFPTGWLTSWMEGAPPAGVRLDELTTSHVLIEGNRIEGTHWGVHARDLTASVTWVLDGNLYQGVAEKVYYDESVESQPEER